MNLPLGYKQPNNPCKIYFQLIIATKKDVIDFVIVVVIDVTIHYVNCMHVMDTKNKKSIRIMDSKEPVIQVDDVGLCVRSLIGCFCRTERNCPSLQDAVCGILLNVCVCVWGHVLVCAFKRVGPLVCVCV